MSGLLLFGSHGGPSQLVLALRCRMGVIRRTDRGIDDFIAVRVLEESVHDEQLTARGVIANRGLAMR